MASRFDRTAVVGLSQVRAALKKADPVMREHLSDAVRQTVIAMAADARDRVPVRTGTLRDHIGWSMAKSLPIGKVGIKSGYRMITLPTRGGGTRQAVHAPRKIAHLVEFGHGGPHPAAPHPFMIPAAEGQRTLFLQRVRRAGKLLEDKLAAGAGRL